jgi:2,5-diketo-D-gluconate reductase B
MSEGAFRMKLATVHGMHMPKLGLGTWRMRGESCVSSVQSAIALGYRHIDTSQRYENEEAIGEGWANADVKRTDIHLTTKIKRENLVPALMRPAIEESLRLLRTDYVDLYMIHWPTPDMDLPALLSAMVRFREEGLVRHIGVCNFPIGLLKRAVEEIQAPICCDQVEYHVLIDQSKLLSYLRSKGMAMVAYVPLAQGRLVDHPELAIIASKHGATPAQVALKWLLDQDEVGAIPKAAHETNQLANLSAVNLSLDDADRLAIAALPKNVRFVNPPSAPAWDS